jgi:hypothetical protein
LVIARERFKRNVTRATLAATRDLEWVEEFANLDS